MLEKEIIHNNDIEKEEINEEPTEEIKPIPQENNYKENEIEKIENTKKEEEKLEETNDNKTKKIDCLDVDECMSISMPIQSEYQELIDNIFYLEVLSKDNKKVGYYIDYTFKPYTYETNEECENKASNINELLKDHIKEIKCDNQTLIITNNKEGDINENS